MSEKKFPDDFLLDRNVQKLMRKCSFYLDDDDEQDILIFRRILEHSMTQGRWWGQMPMVS